MSACSFKIVQEPFRQSSQVLQPEATCTNDHCLLQYEMYLVTFYICNHNSDWSSHARAMVQNFPGKASHLSDIYACALNKFKNGGLIGKRADFPREESRCFAVKESHLSTLFKRWVDKAVMGYVKLGIQSFMMLTKLYFESCKVTASGNADRALGDTR